MDLAILKHTTVVVGVDYAGALLGTPGLIGLSFLREVQDALHGGTYMQIRWGFRQGGVQGTRYSMRG